LKKIIGYAKGYGDNLHKGIKEVDPDKGL